VTTTGGTPISANARAIIAEAAQSDGTPPVSDQALLAAAQGKRRIIEEPDAVGIVGEGELDLVVRPSARGKGLGRTMLQHLLLGAGPESELRAWSHGENPAATALLTASGFSPVRELLRLSLDQARIDSAIADARPMPDGFAVVAFDPTHSQHADDWVRVNARAFASHPEQGAMTRTDFDSLAAEPWFLAEDLRLAYVTEPVGAAPLAGFAWVKTVAEDAAKPSSEAADNQKHVETELYALGVDPDFAGVGLGAALLGETLRQMKSHHPPRITLYVDGDNENAVALYLRAGFEVEQRSLQYLRPAQDATPTRHLSLNNE